MKNKANIKRQNYKSRYTEHSCKEWKENAFIPIIIGVSTM